MATLPNSILQELLKPYLSAPLDACHGDTSSLGEVVQAGIDHDSLYNSLSRYLDILVKWNSRTNLTAVRTPEEIVTRHFGESLFAARCARLLPLQSVLDFGSGAGFPGIPLQLYLPGSRVTLGESQGKKAAFLRTAVRELGLSVEVWGARVSEMPSASRFDLVSMRAVDDPAIARVEAWGRVKPGGWLLQMTTTQASVSPWLCAWSIPGTRDGIVALTQRPD